jgi:hypothetical protein
MARSKKLSAYEKIQAAMVENEKRILEIIRSYTARGEGWDSFMSRHATYNAIARLKAKGLIRYSRPKCGYIAIKHKKKVTA